MYKELCLQFNSSVVNWISLYIRYQNQMSCVLYFYNSAGLVLIINFNKIVSLILICIFNCFMANVVHFFVLLLVFFLERNVYWKGHPIKAEPEILRLRRDQLQWWDDLSRSWIDLSTTIWDHSRQLIRDHTYFLGV